MDHLPCTTCITERTIRNLQTTYMKQITLGLGSMLLPLLSWGQIAFTNASSRMSGTTNSGGCIGVVDMNGDGLDDMAKLHNSRTVIVDYQNSDGSFTGVDYGTIAGESQWGWSIGDMDNNGHKDVIAGGSYDGVHYLNIPSVGNSSLSDLDNGSMFMQCNNIADINNDGANDFFACHDDAAPRQWLNNGSGTLSFVDMINYDTNPASDRSGNYGSVWTDFDNDGDIDLYIAKCRQGVNNAEDPRRWNRLFVNDGNGNYTDQAAAYGVQIKNQSWTADFGDIDNDGDMDMVVTNHDATIQLFENNGSGQFTEITAGSGLEITGFFLQSKFVDMDNDGFLDLMIAGGLERLFRNDGDKTFTAVNNLFPAGDVMHSFATGDLNNDGFQDVYASYGDGYVDPDQANPDRLWLNNGNANHWFSVRLQGVESNRDAIGARVSITGPWGTQIREVRSGESYGMVTSFAASFGLGTATTIPTLTIRWPSGLVETFNDLDVDQTITVVEGTCISPQALITSDGDAVLCGQGDVVALSGNAGFSYLWSTGATTQTINVTEAGSYTLTIDSGDGCTGVTSIFVQDSPDETPTVALSGDPSICEGGSVELTSSAAAGYTWSNGANGQSLTVTASGTYSVTIDGNCGTWTSAPVTVEVLDTPTAPIADDVTIPVAGTADLSATGTSVRWYDAAAGGNLLATGNAYTTPFLNVNTSFWVSDAIAHGGGEAFGGPQNRLQTAMPGAFHTNADNYQIFTANEDFTIRSVKVYAGTTANRTIALVDMSSGATLATGSYAIAAGESRVQLDYEVPAGGPYGLRVVGGNPQLWRDGLGSNPPYPFALGTFGSITSSSVNGANATAYYYFFYDWEVEAPSVVCESPREEVEVFVGPTGVDALAANGMRVWPNPADDLLTVELSDVQGAIDVELFDIAGRSVLAQRTSSAAKAPLVMNVAGLAAGEYLLRVRHDAGSTAHRVVVR
jgi:hypothetical protein